MICEKCNKNIDDDSKFCSFCGNKIEKKVEEVYIDKLKQIGWKQKIALKEGLSEMIVYSNKN